MHQSMEKNYILAIANFSKETGKWYEIEMKVIGE